MTSLGHRLATGGIALVSVGALVIAPTIQTPPSPAHPAVRLAAAVSPAAWRQPWVDQSLAQQPIAPQTNALGALLSLDLGRFIIPPSLGQPFPTPQLPGPTPTPNEFEDAIINTYHAIEPWVRYGFELGTYAVGWVPWVGWLSPQIMIFYNFGERIVESLVVNSANWLWGPLPFGEGLGNIAQDSWNALVQLGRDEWNFWLPPLPPLPFTTQQQAQEQPVTTETLAAAEPAQAPSNTSAHPLRDLLAALRHSLGVPGPVILDGTHSPVSESTPAHAPEVAASANQGQDVSDAEVTPTDVPSTVSGDTATYPSAGEQSASAATPVVTDTGLASPARSRRFGVTHTLTAHSTETSAGGAQKSPVETSDHHAGKTDPPRNRVNGSKNHRLTDTRVSTASSPGAAAN